ncbi:MAG: DUF4430 domain-containing protein [Patescibacteria group bacterium]|nr:DUF4430 domain-containing protein [Patescibacteria group bacterium]
MGGKNIIISNGVKKIIIILLIFAGVGLAWFGAKNDFWLTPDELILDDATQIDKVSEDQKEVLAEASNLSSPEEISSSTKKEVNEAEKVFLVINFGEGGKKEKTETEFKDGMTVFELLREETGQANIFLQTEMYNFGIFIEMIGDKKNGQDGKYWTYYVNGNFAPVAADKFKLKAGDRIEWKFGKSSF